MEIISKTLFWVANSLLIPDIILLLLLFGRALLLSGSFYNQYRTKCKTDQRLGKRIKDLSPSTIDELRAALPAGNSSLFVRYLRDILQQGDTAGEAYMEFLLADFENEAGRDLSLSKLLSKMGPVLGLIGTLIAMSPALVGLSTGDISGMAFNMQVVFATTVVGLVISAVGLLTLQCKQRWYAKDVNRLEYVTRILLAASPNTGGL
jgi:biopolymer transport protein ExbB/TolQ